MRGLIQTGTGRGVRDRLRLDSSAIARLSNAIAGSHVAACLVAFGLFFGPYWLACGASATVLGNEIKRTKTSGPVTVETTLEPESPVIGDEITFTIRVVSEPDVEVLMPEFAEALERYTIVDYVPRQQIESDGRMVQTQQYTLQPFMSGEQSIPPILIEFVDNRVGKQPSPNDFDAYELLTDRIDFDVQSVLEQDATADLKPPLGQLELESRRAFWAWWLIPVAILGVATAGGAWLVWSRKRKLRRRINAYEIAHSRLLRLLEDRKAPQPSLTIEQFFVEISAIVRRYLEDRFELRAPELTTDEFLQVAAAESQLSREHQILLSEFLQQADIVKFAGIEASADDVRRSSSLALRFIEETRENAPDIELDEITNSTETPPSQQEKTTAHV